MATRPPHIYASSLSRRQRTWRGRRRRVARLGGLYRAQTALASGTVVVAGLWAERLFG